MRTRGARRAGGRHSTVTPSSTCPPASPAPTAPSCWPTAAPRSSKSSRPKVIHCGGGRRRAPRSRPATTARCSVSWPARSTASSSTRRCRRRGLRCAACSRRRTRWCGRAGLRSSRSTSSRPQHWPTRYPHLTVTSITPFGLEGPWADKPATEFTLQAWSGGVIGLGRGAQDRAPLFVAGQVGEWLAGAYAAAGTMAVRIRPRGRLDARSADPLPHLLFRVIHRCAGPAVPRHSSAHHSRRRDGSRRAGGAGLRDRAAVVRPVRDDGPRRVDRRGVGPVHHRTGQHPRRGALRVGAREQRRRDSGPVHRLPHSERTGRKRRQRHLVRPVRRTWRVRRPIRATGSPSPVRLTARRRRLYAHPQPAPRLGEHTDHYRRDETFGSRKRAEIAPEMSISAQGSCRSRACGCST